MSKILVIGDPHVQMSTLTVFKEMVEKTIQFVQTNDIELVVITGDTNHTHAVCHSTLLNTAYDWIRRLSAVAPVMLLIGNHDMVAPSRFLESDHSFQVLKGIPNITVVDKPMIRSFLGGNFAFCPYVPPGRLKEALDMAGDWQSCSAVFAHPEITGAKMSEHITCTSGDAWDASWPLLIAGHYHDRQRPYPNVIYVGTPFHHTFSEVTEKTVSVFTVNEGRVIAEDLVDLGLPKKLTIECHVSQPIDLSSINNRDSYRLKVRGSFSELLKFKKSTVYKELQERGVKIVLDADDVTFTPTSAERSTYLEILSNMVKDSADMGIDSVFQETVRNAGA